MIPTVSNVQRNEALILISLFVFACVAIELIARDPDLTQVSGVRDVNEEQRWTYSYGEMGMELG